MAGEDVDLAGFGAQLERARPLGYVESWFLRATDLGVVGLNE